MIIMWMHTFKYYRSSVRKKFWFSSKLINFPKTLISSSSQFFLAIEKVMHVYYKKAVVREYLLCYSIYIFKNQVENIMQWIFLGTPKQPLFYNKRA